VIVLGIGDGGGEHFVHVLAHPLRAELQDVQGFLDLAAADHGRDEIELARRPTNRVADGERFLLTDPARCCWLAH
jgi:hypothetical protein